MIIRKYKRLYSFILIDNLFYCHMMYFNQEPVTRSCRNAVIRGLFASKLENCFPDTSLNRARTFRLMFSWFSKIAQLWT